MADRPKDRPRNEVAERRARKAADAIAKRHHGAGRRAAAFVEEQRQAEQVPGPVSTAVREAIAASGLGLRELARQAGVNHGQLSRFMARERSLSLDAVDRLAPVLKLKVTRRGRAAHDGSARESRP